MTSLQSIPRCGIADRIEHSAWRTELAQNVSCVEIMTAGSWEDDQEALEEVLLIYRLMPLHLHSTALSIGSAALSDKEVQHLKQLIDLINPDTVSDHFSLRSSSETWLENFMPIPDVSNSAMLVRKNIENVQDNIGRRLDLENITHLLGSKASIFRERDFLSELVTKTGCGIVLDINNLYIDAKNFEFDFKDYVDGLPVDAIATIHVAGHETARDGFVIDTHMSDVSDEVLVMLQQIIETYNLQADIILERDNESATKDELLYEIDRIRRVFDYDSVA